jgi:hypothetical protein
VSPAEAEALGMLILGTLTGLLVYIMVAEFSKGKNEE